MYEKYCIIRNQRGFKDSDVAKETGITKSTFSAWKNGASIPKIDKLKKIADFLDVSLNFLITEKSSFKTSEAIHSDYLAIAKQLQDKGITLEEIKLAIDFIENIKDLPN